MENLTITICEDGTVVMIDSAAARVVAESLGVTTVARASHVEPVNNCLRYLFHFIRQRTSDDSRMAEWTRRWPCYWQVTLADAFGGHTLPEVFRDRQDAIAHEVNYLNEKFAE